jgi:hypothetical protein
MRLPNKRFLAILFASVGLCALCSAADDGADPPPLSHLEIALRTREELSILDGAIRQMAEENKLPPGTQVNPPELRLFVKVRSRLYATLGDPSGPKDLLGNPFRVFSVGAHPRLDPMTIQTLSDVASRGFWGAFIGK